MNYYDILEVSPKASQGVIKAAYRSLMQRYHPDKNQGDSNAAEHAVLVTSAYEVLSNVEKRAAYDIELSRLTGRQAGRSNKVNAILATESSEDTRGKYHWLPWVISAVAALFVLFSFLLPDDKSISESELSQPETSHDIGNYESNQFGNVTPASSLEARTIPIFLSDLSVDIEATFELEDATSLKIYYVLTIQTLGAIVGKFESEKFIDFLEINNAYIGAKLQEKLVDANYKKLIKHNGGEYLKLIILEAIDEIAETNRLEEYPSIETGQPTHYGVVDILLPDSFTVKER